MIWLIEDLKNAPNSSMTNGVHKHIKNLVFEIEIQKSEIQNLSKIKPSKSEKLFPENYQILQTPKHQKRSNSKQTKVSFSSQITGKLMRSPKISIKGGNLGLFKRSATGPVLYNNRSFRYSKRSNQTSTNSQKEKDEHFQNLVERKMKIRNEKNSRSLQQNSVQAPKNVDSFFRKRSVKGRKTGVQAKNVFLKKGISMTAKQPYLSDIVSPGLVLGLPHKSLRDLSQVHSKSQSILRKVDLLKKNNISSQKNLAIDNNIKQIGSGTVMKQEEKRIDLKEGLELVYSPSIFTRKKPVWMKKNDDHNLSFKLSPKLDSRDLKGDRTGSVIKRSERIIKHQNLELEGFGSKERRNISLTPRIGNLEIRLTDSEQKLWKRQKSAESREVELSNRSFVNVKGKIGKYANPNMNSLDSLKMPTRTGQGLNLMSKLETDSRISNNNNQTQGCESKEVSVVQSPVHFKNLRNQKKLLNPEMGIARLEGGNSDFDAGLLKSLNGLEGGVSKSRSDLRIEKLENPEIGESKVSPKANTKFVTGEQNQNFFHSERKDLHPKLKSVNFKTLKLETENNFYSHPNIRNQEKKESNLPKPVSKIENRLRTQMNETNNPKRQKIRQLRNYPRSLKTPASVHTHKSTHSASDLQQILKKYKATRKKPVVKINEYSYYKKSNKPTIKKHRPVKISRDGIFKSVKSLGMVQNQQKRVFYNHLLTKGREKVSIPKVNQTFQDLYRNSNRAVAPSKNNSEVYFKESQTATVDLNNVLPSSNRVSVNENTQEAGSQNYKLYNGDQTEENFNKNETQNKKRKESQTENEVVTETVKNEDDKGRDLLEKGDVANDDANHDTKARIEGCRFENISNIKFFKEVSAKLKKPVENQSRIENQGNGKKVIRYSNYKMRRNEKTSKGQRKDSENDKIRCWSAINHQNYSRSPSPITLIPKPNYSKMEAKRSLKLAQKPLIISRKDPVASLVRSPVQTPNNKTFGKMGPNNYSQVHSTNNYFSSNQKMKIYFDAKRDTASRGPYAVSLPRTSQNQRRITRSISPNYTYVINPKISRVATPQTSKPSIVKTRKIDNNKDTKNHNNNNHHNKRLKDGKMVNLIKKQRSDRKIDREREIPKDEGNRSRSLVKTTGRRKRPDYESVSKSPVTVNNVDARKLGENVGKRAKFPMQRKYVGMRLKQTKGSLERKVPKIKGQAREKSGEQSAVDRVNRFENLPSINDIRSKKPGKSILKKMKSKR